MLRVSDRQVRKLMQEYSKDGKISRASMAAGIDRRTGSRYLKAGKLPSQLKQEQGERSYRTRKDPFNAVWPEVVRMLRDAPELEGKALFEHLHERGYARVERLKHEGREAEAEAEVLFEPGQVRTFQRRIKQWRATSGPDKEVFFAQEHRPGEAMQTDFTWATELGVTIGGEAFAHMLCHSVLPYSNWQWATVCRTENFLALKKALQNHVVRLGQVPRWHQTDQSTSATHQVNNMAEFNAGYKALVKHLGMEPRTIGVGKKEQNGDIESANGALKRRLKQHLLLRGGADFESIADYETFLTDVLTRANALRQTKFAKEQAVMRPLKVSRLPDYREEKVRVTAWSTIRILRNAYSVPSRLIGERVKVRVYDDRVEVWYAQKLQLKVTRLLGDSGHHINYRHLIWSLVRKPGAFARYRYRESLFPTVTFRRAYDALEAKYSAGRKADLEYLRILHHAAATTECDVEAALILLLEVGELTDADSVKDLVSEQAEIEVPALSPLSVNLSEYDVLTPTMEVTQ